MSNWEFIKDDVFKLYDMKMDTVTRMGGYGDKYNFKVGKNNEYTKFVLKVLFRRFDENRCELIAIVCTSSHEKVLFES